MGVAVKIIITTGYPQGAGSSPLCGWGWISTISLSPYLNSLWVEPICTRSLGVEVPCWGAAKSLANPRIASLSPGFTPEFTALAGHLQTGGLGWMFSQMTKPKAEASAPTNATLDRSTTILLIVLDRFFFFFITPFVAGSDWGNMIFPRSKYVLSLTPGIFIKSTQK